MNDLYNPALHQVTKVLNIKQVSEIIGLSRSTIYELLNPKSKYYDATFPKPFNLTMNRIGWVIEDINDWIENKIAQRS